MSRKESHKKEMEEFRRAQKQKQKESLAATAGSSLKNTADTSNVTTYNTSGGVTVAGLTPELRIENSILDARQKEKDYAGFAETFAQKAVHEESVGNYPDSRYLWGQAASLKEKSREYGEKASFFEELSHDTSLFFRRTSTASKTAKDNAQKESAAASGTFADREIVQLQIDQTTKEMQDYINASGGRAEDSVLDWYDRRLRNLNQSLNDLPTEARREDILLQALGGNYYAGKPTLGGTAAQASLGVLGLDAPADFRDLAYDLNHRDSIPKGQLALDALALLPLVGGLKYMDDAAGGIKAAAKQADNLMDTGEELVYNGGKAVSIPATEIVKEKISSLPANSHKLLEKGWMDVTPSKMTANTTSKMFRDGETGLTVRFDKGREGAFGFAGQDHYHILNPSSTGKHDYYLDANGNPVAKNARASHIIPNGGNS